MPQGTLQEKNGKYYVLLYLKENGQRKVKWIATGLEVKGNKRRAEQELDRLKREYDEIEEAASKVMTEADEPFMDYMNRWLKIIEPGIAKSTYSGYKRLIEAKIERFFRPLGLSIGAVTPGIIQRFYQQLMEDGSLPNTVIHYHALLHRAFKMAVRIDIIPSNPAEKVEKPKRVQFHGGFYSKEEVMDLFKIVEGDAIEIPVIFAAYYGMRRSEALGVKWDAINFEEKTISIRHKIVEIEQDGKTVSFGEDVMKTKSSLRTLPLIPSVEKKLVEHKAKIEEHRRLFKRSYSTEAENYVCVDEMGNLIRPNYITTHFNHLLKKNDLRHIRFHDLRHTCASLLLSNGISMKQIQLWLGHSTFSTTADIYSHLDYGAQIESAEMMENIFL